MSQPKEYIVLKPASDGEFVTVTQGETGYGEMDSVTRFNADFAESFNKAMGHSVEDLHRALVSSFSGNWNWIFKD
tara:strand:- start:2 stop:226 length:225 start_codon:yes stop_codon:yes gene_type:complete